MSTTAGVDKLQWRTRWTHELVSIVSGIMLRNLVKKRKWVTGVNCSVRLTCCGVNTWSKIALGLPLDATK